MYPILFHVPFQAITINVPAVYGVISRFWALELIIKLNNVAVFGSYHNMSEAAYGFGSSAWPFWASNKYLIAILCWPFLAPKMWYSVALTCIYCPPYRGKMVLSTPCSSAALHYYLHVHWTTMFPFVFFSCFALSSTVLWDDGIIFSVVANCCACRLSPHRQYRRRCL